MSPHPPHTPRVCPKAPPAPSPPSTPSVLSAQTPSVPRQYPTRPACAQWCGAACLFGRLHPGAPLSKPLPTHPLLTQRSMLTHLDGCVHADAPASLPTNPPINHPNPLHIKPVLTQRSMLNHLDGRLHVDAAVGGEGQQPGGHEMQRRGDRHLAGARGLHRTEQAGAGATAGSAAGIGKGGRDDVCAGWKG